MKKVYWLSHSTILALSLGTVVGNPILAASAQQIPQAKCVSAYGETKCGYACVAAYGEINCADWPGGACEAAYGNIVCGPPAPENWSAAYRNRSSSRNSSSGVTGAWAVQMSNWNGILRMQGNTGTMVLISEGGASVEQRMTLQENPEGGYILKGKVLTSYIKEQYYADNFYIKRFAKKTMSIKNCDQNQNCNSVNLIYLGK